MSDSCLSYILDNLRGTFFHKDKLKLEKLQHKVFFHAKNNWRFVVFTLVLHLFRFQGRNCLSFSSELKNYNYIYFLMCFF